MAQKAKGESQTPKAEVEEFKINEVVELEGRLGFMLESNKRSIMVSVPPWAIEQRQVEYELDPSDHETALSMILHEPFLPRVPDEEIPLFACDHRAEARQKHVKLIEDVPVNVVIPAELVSQLKGAYPGSETTRQKRNKRFVEARCRVKEARAKKAKKASEASADSAATFAWKKGDK